MNIKATLLFAAIACVSLLGYGQNYPMSAALTSVTDCSGFFMDSGAGNGNYGPNQNFTTTICPDGSTGTHVQLVFGNTSITGGDELCFFDGPNTASPPLSCASDFSAGAAFIIQATAANITGCITITFNSDASGEGAGWSADINCVPSCQTIYSVLDHADPAVEPIDTGWIDICPGERVFFYGKGSYPQDGVVYNHSDLTSNFEWDFGDGVITYGPTVSHIFEEPGGYVVQLEITDQLGCKNTNFISQRVRVAPKPSFELGAWPATICVGDTVSLNSMVNAMDQNHTISVMPMEGNFQTAGVRSDSLALPDGDGTCYNTTISFTGFSPGQVLTDINDLIGIFVTMEHSWMRDLEINVTCPNGQSAILHNHPGQTGGEVFLGIPYEADEGLPVPIPGTGYEYGWAPSPQYNQTWIQYANTHPNAGTLPAGTYNSSQPLTNYLGCPLNGDWEIEVCDLWGIDNGYIFSWAIEFDPSLYPSVESFTPNILTWGWDNHPSIIYTNPDSLLGSPFNAGEVAYTFVVEDDFGCSWDTMINIQVLPSTHPLCHTCGEILTPAPDTVVCVGESVSIDVMGSTSTIDSITFESYDNYALGASNHPVANPYNSVIGINSITPGTIANATQDIISVCMDISTDFDADLQIFLRSPNNQLLMLSTNNGGSGDNYTQTCFSPSAITPITSGAAPFTGNFQPEGSWAVLNGAPINGNWTLRVSDAFGLNAMGKVNWWSITFRSQNNLTYTWTPTGGLSCNNCPTPVATPLNNTNYIVTASDNYGCVRKDTIGITVLNSFSAPTVTLSQQNNGTITANWNDISPGLTYEVNVNGTGWVPSNNGLLSHVISGLLNGDMVSVEVRTFINGVACQVGVGTASMTYVFCPINAFITNPAPYAVNCNGVCDESIQISVTGGQLPYNYDITNITTGSTNSQNNGNINGLCPGSYQVVVTDATNCTTQVNFTVGEPMPLVTAATQVSPVTCAGGNNGCAVVNATGGTGNYTYEWGNPNMSNTQNICGLSAGPVSVTVTDANGCMSSGTVNITSLPAITLNFSQTDAKCNGSLDGTASVVATGGAGGFSYNWSGGTTPNQSTTGGLGAGTYSVTVTDINNCQAFGNVTVSEPATSVEADASQTVVSCYSANGSAATVAPSGGTGPYTFAWMPGSLNTQTISNLSIGSYLVTVTDAGGCTATDEVDVVQWPAYNILISSTPPSCNGIADGQMNVVVLDGGNGTYTYNWSNAQTGDLISGLLGDVNYTVTVTDGQGCTGTMSKFLEDPSPMSLFINTTDAKCAGSQDGTATVTTVNGGTSPFSYAWSANGQSTQTANNLVAGLYSVTVTDAGGCTIAGTATVDEPMAIVVDFTVLNNECYGYENGVAEVEVNGGQTPYSYSWSSGSASAKITDLAAATYYITITDANGCENIDSVNVGQPAPVDAALEITDVSCFEGRDGKISITPIGGTPPFTFSLNGDDYYGSSTLIALVADDYTVYLKDAKGCIYNLPAVVNEPPEMSVDILVWGQDLEEYIVDYGSSFQLEASVTNGQGNLIFSWDAAYCGTLLQDTMSDCTATLTWGTIQAIPNYTNDYFVLAIDEKGCEAEDHLQVHVRKTRRVLVPTGFSPNSSGLNDLLLVHGKSGTKIKLFQIFDRWGELLFQDTDFDINSPDRGWDGTFKSKEMPPGVYGWYVEVIYEDGMTESFKGETTLIR